MSDRLIAEVSCCVLEISMSDIIPVFMRDASHVCMAGNLAAEHCCKAALLEPFRDLTLANIH